MSSSDGNQRSGGGQIICKWCGAGVKSENIKKHNPKCPVKPLDQKRSTGPAVQRPPSGGYQATRPRKDRPPPIFDNVVDTPQGLKKKAEARRVAAADTDRKKGEKWVEDNLELVSPAHVSANRGLPGDDRCLTLKWTERHEFHHVSEGEDFTVVLTGLTQHPVFVVRQNEGDFKRAEGEEDVTKLTDWTRPMTAGQIEGQNFEMEKYLENPTADNPGRCCGLSVTCEIVLPEGSTAAPGEIRASEVEGNGSDVNLKKTLGSVSPSPMADGFYYVARPRDEDFDSFDREVVDAGSRWMTVRAGEREEGQTYFLMVGDEDEHENGFQPAVIKLNNVPPGSMVNLKMIVHREFDGECGTHSRYMGPPRVGTMNWKQVAIHHFLRRPLYLPAKDNDWATFLKRLGGVLSVIGAVVGPILPPLGLGFAAAGAGVAAAGNFLA